ncbi:MAG: glutathione S-transferase family protein [Magnetovibrio sp.]|nr:glutathione S-transferase family protein [Magnetovibrio sp.]
MSEIILHHYWPSPVSEKVRVVLGIKGLSWRSVEIPRLPPKPDLMPLTGGYRLTPVMQIGADIFCDSLSIIRELQRRHPEPTLYPGGAQGMPWAVAQWTDTKLFQNVIQVVFADSRETMPEGFWVDRGGLYFGAGYDGDAIEAARVQNLVDIRAQFGFVDARVGEGRDFLLGAEPGLPDALAYYLVWFFRGRYSGGPDFLRQFPSLLAWEGRMQALGHGSHEDMSAEDALEIARAAEPAAETAADPDDPTGLQPGDAVEVVAGAGGAAVAGEVVSLSRDHITIRREDPRVGAVCVHFPRIGYAVRRV